MFRLSLSLALTLALSSCMTFSDRSFRPLADSLREQNPAITLHKEMALNLGSGVFNLVGALSPDSPEFAELDGIQIAMYRVSGQQALAAFNEEEFMIALQHRDRQLTWERIVRVNDEDERVWIYAGMDLRTQRLVALSVFTLDRDALVMMRLHGDIDQLFLYAMESAGDAREPGRARSMQDSEAGKSRKPAQQAVPRAKVAAYN